MLCSSYRLFQQLSLCAVLCTLLATQAHATPLALNQRSTFEEASAAYAALKNARGLDKRDVVAPPIIKPDASSVWPIGTTQEVIWDISDLPPDSQITNPMGRVILGRDSGDSLNLDLDHPLAQGFHIRQGRVNVTVPNVPPRNDYLIVLMGNSGNTSPSFAITQISNGNNPPSRPSSSRLVVDPEPSLPGIAPTRSLEPPILSSTTITDPIPISGTTITGTWDTSIPTESNSPSGSSPAASTTGSAEDADPTDLNQDDGSAAVARASVTFSLMLAGVVGGLLVVF